MRLHDTNPEEHLPLMMLLATKGHYDADMFDYVEIQSRITYNPISQVNEYPDGESARSFEFSGKPDTSYAPWLDPDQ